MILPILAISITALFVLLMLSQEDEFGWPYRGDDNPYENDVFDGDREYDPYGGPEDESTGAWGESERWQSDSAREEDNYDYWGGEDTRDQDSQH